MGIIALVALVLPLITKMPRPKEGQPAGESSDAAGEAVAT